MAVQVLVNPSYRRPKPLGIATWNLGHDRQGGKEHVHRGGPVGDSDWSCRQKTIQLGTPDR